MIASIAAASRTDAIFSAGILEVKGNFIQKSTDTASCNNFKAGGTHKVLLSGSGTQVVTFEDADYFYFVTLELDLYS